MNQDIFNPTRVTATVGGKEIIFETGRLANQAHGAVWVQCGGTVVLVTVCSQALEFDKGFFPLTVEYSEKMYAAGRIPGSFFRREIGRPSERETLVSRLIDRPIRPLFPKGLNEDVQVLASVISADQENESDVLALTGASAAVMLSPLPFEGPVAGGRIGRIDGQFVLNPTFEEQERSDLNIVFAASAAALGMDAVLLTPGCSDPLYRRSARVSMGTVFQIPWTFTGDWPGEGMEQLNRLGFRTAAMALSDDSVSIDDRRLMAEEKLAVILGSEGDGLTETTIARCDYTVKIPMYHGVDSLNVAAASAVAFWQLRKL